MKKPVALAGLLLLAANIFLPSVTYSQEMPDQVPVHLRPDDPVLLTELDKRGMSSEYVKLDKDYGLPSQGRSPYARTYKDTLTNQSITLFSPLPRVDSAGDEVSTATTKWFEHDGKYYTTDDDKRWNNVFWGMIDGAGITVITENNQPDGRLSGQTLTWQPQVFLGGVEQLPRLSSGTLVDTDPVNPNYTENTVEWNYGIVTRRVRIIEGSIQEYWVFASNPRQDVLIRHNQSGDFSLEFGEYGINNDEERVTADQFNAAAYPLTVRGSSTFYPGAGAVDGYVQNSIPANRTWAQVYDGAGTEAYDSDPSAFATGIRADSNTNKWNRLRRGIFLFDTSALDDSITITSATLSLYAHAGNADPAGWAPELNIYSSAPSSNSTLVASDYAYAGFGVQAFADTGVSYATWDASADYKDFIFNSAGIAAISLHNVSRFSVRTQYDATDTPPAWSSGADMYMQVYTAEQGSGFEPKLVVVYPAEPELSTNEASSVEETTATLDGAIIDIGLGNASARGFEWDTDSGAPYADSWSENGSFGTANYTHSIGSLTQGELYYYTASATNVSGTGVGNEMTFLTKPIEPSSLAVTANGSVSTSADLSWAKGIGAQNTYIRRKEGSAPANTSDGTLVYNNVATNFVDTGLTRGVVYYWKGWSYVTEGGREQYSDGDASDSITLDRVLNLWYEPTAMVSSSTLPDRVPTAQDGTIAWGYNPAGVIAAMGAVESSGQPATGTAVDDPVIDLLPVAEPSDWFEAPDVSGDLITNPLRPFVTMMSDTTALTELQAWRIYGLAVVLMVTVTAAVAVRGHLLISGIAAGASIGAMTALTIFPLWALVFAIGAVAGGVVAERSPSL